MDAGLMGLITDIVSFSLNDGPGIRTTVFTKGCPLACVWCHNPETWKMAPQVMWYEEKCVGCGACAAVCPAKARLENGGWAGNCTGCGACVPVCPSGANVLCGKRISPQAVADIVAKDMVFFEKSQGGVTFSGGEPAMQAGFVHEASRLIKARGIHVAVETSGHASWAAMQTLTALADLILFDWKVTDDALHKTLTGASNRLIEENLIRLSELGKTIRLRCPLISGYNDTDDHLTKIAQLSHLAGICGVELLPYHDFGRDKKKRIGGSAMPAIRILKNDELALIHQRLKQLGCEKLMG